MSSLYKGAISWRLRGSPWFDNLIGMLIAGTPENNPIDPGEQSEL